MNIYTSYFARERELPTTIVPVSIARMQPKGGCMLSYPKLAPSADCLAAWKAHHDGTAYIQQYNREVLDILSVEEVLRDFEALANGQDVVMMCWEKAGSFCHRRLVAKWMEKNGLYVPEWGELDSISLFN